MKKKLVFFKKGARAVLAAVLAAAMAVPGMPAYTAGQEDASNMEQQAAVAAIPAPIKKIDFNEGLKEAGVVSSSDRSFWQKTEEEKESVEYLDSNNIVIGNPEEAVYVPFIISNQPSTCYEAGHGSVLYMGETKTVPAITINTDDPSVEGGRITIQQEIVSASELRMDNPFAHVISEWEDGTETADYDGVTQPLWERGVTVTYWIKVPIDTNGNYIPGTVLSWRAGASSDQYGTFQIDDDNSVMFTMDDPSVQDKEDGNIFYMNSWKSSTKINDIKNSETVPYEKADSYADSPVSINNTANENAGKWHQVAVTIQNDWIEFYLDGKCVDVKSGYSTLGSSEIGYEGAFRGFNCGTGLRYGFGASRVPEASAATPIMEWLSREDVELYVGGLNTMAQNTGLSEKNAAVMLDDLTFYDQLLTADQIEAIYERDTKEESPIAELYSVEDDLRDIDGVAKKSYIQKDSIYGQHKRNVIVVPANTKIKEKTGIVLTRNPFAGKDLQGATISYWTKQSPYNGTVSATAGVTFLDGEKRIEHEKAVLDPVSACSILSLESDGKASFVEGFSKSVYRT